MANEFEIGRLIVWKNAPTKTNGRPYLIIDIDNDGNMLALGTTSKFNNGGEHFRIKFNNGELYNISNRYEETFSIYSDDIEIYIKNNFPVSINSAEDFENLLDWYDYT